MRAGSVVVKTGVRVLCSLMLRAERVLSKFSQLGMISFSGVVSMH